MQFRSVFVTFVSLIVISAAAAYFQPWLVPLAVTATAALAALAYKRVKSEAERTAEIDAQAKIIKQLQDDVQFLANKLNMYVGSRK